jgi:hypothetical protein
MNIYLNPESPRKMTDGVPNVIWKGQVGNSNNAYGAPRNTFRVVEGSYEVNFIEVYDTDAAGQPRWLEVTDPQIALVVAHKAMLDFYDRLQEKVCNVAN